MAADVCISPGQWIGKPIHPSAPYQWLTKKRVNPTWAGMVCDASMSELRRQIEYKAVWNGVEVVIADRWYPSSKTCSNCGNVKTVLTLSERIYHCDACGFELDRDLNAARNLAALA